MYNGRGIGLILALFPVFSIQKYIVSNVNREFYNTIYYKLFGNSYFILFVVIWTKSCYNEFNKGDF